MSVKSVVYTTIREVAEEQAIALPPLTDDLPLMESGLDSLSIAILVARLEEVLGLDPFTDSDDFPDIVTLGGFVEFYETIAKPHGIDPPRAQ